MKTGPRIGRVVRLTLPPQTFFTKLFTASPPCLPGGRRRSSMVKPSRKTPQGYQPRSARSAPPWVTNHKKQNSLSPSEGRGHGERGPLLCQFVQFVSPTSSVPSVPCVPLPWPAVSHLIDILTLPMNPSSYLLLAYWRPTVNG